MEIIDGVEIPKPMPNYEEALRAKTDEALQCIAELKKVLVETYGQEHADAIMAWVDPCLHAGEDLRMIEQEHWFGRAVEALRWQPEPKKGESIDFTDILRRAQDWKP